MSKETKIAKERVLEIIDEEIDRLNRLDLDIGVTNLTKVITNPLRNIKREIRMEEEENV